MRCPVCEYENGFLQPSNCNVCGLYSGYWPRVQRLRDNSVKERIASFLDTVPTEVERVCGLLREGVTALEIIGRKEQ